MRSVTLAVAATVLAAGAAYHQGRQPTHSLMGASFEAGTPVGETRATMHAPQAGTLTQLHWEIAAAGSNGGGSTFTLAVTVEGVTQCSIAVACTTTGSGTQACDASFAEGDDVHVAVIASDCATLPRFVMSTAWRW